MKGLAHDPDDVVRTAAELDRLTNNIRIATEPALPQPETQNNDEVFAVQLFFGGEDAAEQRLAFHYLEEAIADLDGGNSFGFAIAGHYWIPAAVGRDFFK